MFLPTELFAQAVKDVNQIVRLINSAARLNSTGLQENNYYFYASAE